MTTTMSHIVQGTGTAVVQGAGTLNVVNAPDLLLNGGFEADATATTTAMGAPDDWTGDQVIRFCEDDADGGWTPRPFPKVGRFAVGILSLESPAGPTPDSQPAPYDAFLPVNGALQQTVTGLAVGASYRLTLRVAKALAETPGASIGLESVLSLPSDHIVEPTLAVSVDGDVVGTFSGFSNAVYAPIEVSFVAAAPSAVLLLRNATPPVADPASAPYGVFVSLLSLDDARLVRQ